MGCCIQLNLDKVLVKKELKIETTILKNILHNNINFSCDMLQEMYWFLKTEYLAIIIRHTNK